MPKRLERLAPLITGLLMIVFVLLGVHDDGSRSGVATTAGGNEALTYFQAHYSRIGGGALSLLLGALAGIFFYGFVRSHLSRSTRGVSLATIGFSGALVLAAAALLEAGIDFAINDVGTHLDASTARVLNILQSDLNAMFIQGGLSILMLGFGAAMLRGRSMPRWLGWATIVIGILAPAGPLVSIAIPLEAAWIVVMGIALCTGAANPSSTAGQPEAVDAALSTPGI